MQAKGQLEELKESKALQSLIPEKQRLKKLLDDIDTTRKFQAIPQNRIFTTILGPSGEVLRDEAPDICFARFWHNLHQVDKKEKPRPVYFRVRIQLEGSECLKEDEAAKWIQLCCDNTSIMPHSADKFEIVDNERGEPKGKSVIGTWDLTEEKWTSSVLYASLCIFRDMRECPHVVRFATNLIEEYGCDFSVAYMFARSSCSTNPGHSFLPVSMSVYYPNESNKDVGVLYVLDKLLKGKNILGHSHVLKKSIGRGEDTLRYTGRWRVRYGVTENSLGIRVRDQGAILSPDILPIAKATSKEEAENLKETVAKESKIVEF